MNRPIRYVINPLAAKSSLWMPQPHQLIGGHRNPNYLNSVWLGFGLNVLNIPERLYLGCLKPLFHFRPVRAVVGLIATPVTTLLGLWHGLTGQLMALPLSQEEVVFGTVLCRKQAQEALEQGCDLVVLDLMLFEAQRRGLLPEGAVIPGFPPGWNNLQA